MAQTFPPVILLSFRSYSSGTGVPACGKNARASWLAPPLLTPHTRSGQEIKTEDWEHPRAGVVHADAPWRITSRPLPSASRDGCSTGTDAFPLTDQSCRPEAYASNSRTPPAFLGLCRYSEHVADRGIDCDARRRDVTREMAEGVSHGIVLVNRKGPRVLI